MLHKYKVLVGCAIGLLLLVAIGVEGWDIAQTPSNRLIAPGATDVQVEVHKFGEQYITYRAPGPNYAWYFTVTHRLDAEGWSAPVFRNRGVRATPEVHWRISQFLFVYLSEQVALQGDPNFARITVRRQIIIPWRKYLP